MIKWIIELLKRIFMQPETTDRLTEDTNVNEKKILNRKTLDTTVDTGDAYWTFYENFEDITYAKAGNNTYLLEGYYGKSYGGDAVILRPLNQIVVSIDTGKMLQEGYSAVQDSGAGFVTLNMFLSIASPGVEYTGTKIYRIIYTTKITEDTL